MTSPVELWEAVLDDLDARLDRVEADLDGGAVTVLEPFRPPVGLAQLPAECLDRAMQISRRNQRLVEVTQRLIADVPLPPARLSMPTAPSTVARFEYLA